MYNKARQPQPRVAETTHGQQRTPEHLVRFAEGVRNVVSTTRTQLPGRHPAAQQLPIYRTQHDEYDMLGMIGSYPMLREACECIRYRGEIAGPDGGTYYTKVQAAGLNEYLRETGLAIKEGSYQFSPLQRLQIPKVNGDKRTLDIPTIQDRVVECSMARILYEWCSSTWSHTSMGFRPGISLPDIMQQVEAMTIPTERPIWLTTDIADAFGSIPHATLVEIIAKEVPHDGILQMINRWLRPGSWKNTKGQAKRGIPQGSPLSPFMLNLYMDKALDQRLGRMKIPFVRYADDLLLPCKDEDEAHQRLEEISAWIQPWGLKLKEAKTLITDTRAEPTPYIGFMVSQAKGRLKLDIDVKRHAHHLAEELNRQAGINSDAREFSVKGQDQTSQVKMVIEGWLQHYAPGISNGRLRTFSKTIKHALTTMNIEGVQTEWIRDIWKRSRDRWDAQWDQTQHGHETELWNTPGSTAITLDGMKGSTAPETSESTERSMNGSMNSSTSRSMSTVSTTDRHDHHDWTEDTSPAQLRREATGRDRASDRIGNGSSTCQGFIKPWSQDHQDHGVAGGKESSRTSIAMTGTSGHQAGIDRTGTGVCDGSDNDLYGSDSQYVDNTASGLKRKNVQHAALWLFDGSEQLPAPVAVLDPSAPRRPGPMDQDWALTIV